MKRLGLTTLTGMLAMAVIVATSATQSQARPQYSKEFGAKFINPDSTDLNAKAFAAAAAEAKCALCHDGDSKKNRNAFGRELAKLLHNEKDNSKIDEAFENVLKIKAKPDDPDSPTYGDLMKQGKLPASK